MVDKMNSSERKREKSTSELEKIIGRTHLEDAGEFLQKETDSLLQGEHVFTRYMRSMIKEKGMKQQRVFLEADISERYGYKLISGEKRTKQRDVILRICYAARFNIEETQKALRIYGMPELYVKIPRDALLMIAFNEMPGSIIEVNAFLRENGAEILRSSGLQE